MTETISQESKTPGIAIFVAVLNFLGAGFFMLLSLVAAIVLVFGNAMGIYDLVTQKINQYYAPGTMTMGMNMIFILMLVVGIVFALFYLFIGIGLMKGKKLAWYFQVAMSVLGLLGFPFGTLLNAVILFLFFRPTTRSYFKV